MDEHEAHLEKDLEFVGDVRGSAIGETFSTIAALKKEAPALGCLSKLLLQCFDFPGCNERRKLREFIEGGFERGLRRVLNLMRGGFGAPGAGGPGLGGNGGVSKGGHVAVQLLS
jgi:hypothetical protein